MENKIIRPVMLQDAGKIADIYNMYVLNTTITYEYKPVSIDEMEHRIEKVTAAYPWLVCEYNGVIAGYAYASRHHERAAFDWNSEVSVYIDDRFRGLGIGTGLYEQLLRVLYNMGICNVYSLIDYPNVSSEKLHEKFGFTREVIEENIGFKFGRWTSLMTMVLRLRKTDNPAEVKHCWRQFFEN